MRSLFSIFLFLAFLLLGGAEVIPKLISLSQQDGTHVAFVIGAPEVDAKKTGQGFSAERKEELLKALGKNNLKYR